MKHLGMMLAVVASLGAASATATSVRRDVPLRRAELLLADRPELRTHKSLTMYGTIGERFQINPTLFVLREDTGIRCLRAPCPSEQYAQFRITETTTVGMSRKYTAVEEDAANRHEKRTLSVLDHSRNPHFFVPYVWEVTVTGQSGQETQYVGNPASLRTLPGNPRLLPDPTVPQPGEQHLDVVAEDASDRDGEEQEQAALELARDPEIPAAESDLASGVIPPKFVVDRRSDLVEMRKGRVINERLKKSLTSGRLLTGKRPVIFTFFEERQVFCVKAPCPPQPATRHFAVYAVENAGCGSLRYLAKEASPGRGAIEIVDHSTRRCRDRKPFQWEVRVFEADRQPVRFFFGNPKAVEIR